MREQEKLLGYHSLDAAQWVAQSQMIFCNAKAMMTKAQDRYTSVVKKNVWGSIESGRKGLVGLEELWNIHGIIHQVVRNVDLCVSNKKILHLDVCVLVLGKRGGKSWHPVIYVSLFQKYHRDEKDVLVAKLSATTTIIRVMDWCGWQGDGLTTSTRRSE